MVLTLWSAHAQSEGAAGILKRLVYDADRLAQALRSKDPLVRDAADTLQQRGACF
jgi:hypothetical protein